MTTQDPMAEVSLRPVSIIELLGPSGTGKTTLLDHFFVKNRLYTNSKDIVSRASLDKNVKLNSASSAEIQDDAAIHDWLEFVFKLLAHASAPPSQRLKALDFCRRALNERAAVLRSNLQGSLLLHDELLLHRGFSILPFSKTISKDAELFFQYVPLPQEAIICFAKPQTLMDRIKLRKTVPNCYKGLSSNELDRLLVQLVEVCFIARDVLTSRGLPCTLLSFDEAIETNYLRLQKICSTAKNR